MSASSPEKPRAPRFDELLERFFFDPNEEVGRFLESAPEAGAGPPGRPEEEWQRFLSLQLGGETYALPVAQVREILKVPTLTEVPRAAPALLGLLNLRGEILPVYDVKVRLALASNVPQVLGAGDVPRGARVVVVRVPDGDAGVQVDSVEGVVKLSSTEIEASPPAWLQRPGLIGLGRKAERMYVLLDVKQVLP